MDAKRVHARASKALYDLDVYGWAGGVAPTDEYDDVAWSFVATFRDLGLPGIEARIREEFPRLSASESEMLAGTFAE
jgi:hypothetical protein